MLASFCTDTRRSHTQARTLVAINSLYLANKPRVGGYSSSYDRGLASASVSRKNALGAS